MFPSVRKVPSNPLPASKKGIKKAPAKQPSSSLSSSSSSSASIVSSLSKSSISQSKGRIKSSPSLSSSSSSSSFPSKSTSLIVRPFPNKHRASPAPVTIISKSPVRVLSSSSHHPILQNVHYLPLVMQHIDPGWHAILRLTCKAFHRAWKGKAPLLKIYFTYYTSFPQQASRVSCSCYHHR
eukprot:TRINITY_DN10028_c0_g1_i1.p1 TRINITY_DN10028_c0_g1~~TRINITY_DN10028_c0_g1_i1.p1  ORF type:complete len:181 (-),score=40.08 TRINITY_DN10028_c0_g1_i1:39-581(-)